MGEKETWLQKAGEVPTFLMGLGLLASPQGVRKTATKLGAKRVLKEFGEEVADPLYHNTRFDELLGILKEGNLKGPSSISFTRNPNLDLFGPAQIMVSKDKIKSSGRIRPTQYMKELHKHEAEEVFFTPQQRHQAIKGVERARTPVREAKIPTEKFEGIHIDKFMFEPGDNIATTVAMESAKPGGKPDQPVIEYITELMREAHKRKVPIILGPEATETFYKLGMDKKLPKTWQGRLVTDRTVSVGRTQLTEPTKKAVGATPRDLRQKLEILDRSQNLGINKKTDKRFWGIVVDPLDGNIEYTIPYSKAYTAEFHHSKYMPEHLAKEVESGEKILMYFHKGLRHIRGPVRDDLFRRRYIPMVYDHRTGRSVVGVGVNEKLGVDLIPWEYHYGAQVDQKLYDKIYEQIEILPSPKSKLPGS